MSASRSYDVIIAGAGPAGLATGLYLLHLRPQLAGRIVAIDKARHPRVKVCAGGLIPRTMTALAELGLSLDVPAVEVHAGTARTEAGSIDLGESREPLCTIVRRDEFDALVARTGRERGLVLVEDARVLEVAHGNSGIRVATTRGEFEAGALVGADGSGSRVRTTVFGRTKENVGRALMVDVPVDAERAGEFTRRLYRFDFNCVCAGIRGYSWSFPCLIDGQPHLNVGIYDQSPRLTVESRQKKPPLLAALRLAFPDIELGDPDGNWPAFKAFPIRWYSAADRYAAGRTILAGDAAGVDPLMGEGISCAFEHGKLAAGAIVKFLDGDRRAFEIYGCELHRSAIGRKLRRLAFAARRFYGPRHRLYFRLAGMSRRAQELGVDWFNGVRGLDEAPVIEGILRWAGAVLFGMPVR
jgi:menaquinone-9 beta-reductase